MKIKKLARLCSARKRIQLFDGETVKYIGDGSAVYPVWGMPELDKESLMVVFDIPEKKQKDFFMSREPAPESINLKDVDETEQMVERLGARPERIRAAIVPPRSRRALPSSTVRQLSPPSPVFSR